MNGFNTPNRIVRTFASEIPNYFFELPIPTAFEESSERRGISKTVSL